MPTQQPDAGTSMGGSVSRVPMWSLEQFQQGCRLLLEEKENLIRLGRGEMRRLLSPHLAAQNKEDREEPLASTEKELMRRFHRQATEVFKAEEWLEKHRYTYEDIVSEQPEELDLSHAPVAAAWREFAIKERPRWKTRLHESLALVRASGWEEIDEPLDALVEALLEELSEDAWQNPDAEFPNSPSQAPHSGAPDSAFDRHEDSSTVRCPLTSEDYYDESDEAEDRADEMDEDCYADKADLKLCSASPQDGENCGAPGQVQAADEPPQAAPLQPQPFSLSPEHGPSWHALFAGVVPRVFQECGVDEAVGNPSCHLGRARLVS